jgi:glycosyltransferase involved in cell wall biosynthesis
MELKRIVIVHAYLLHYHYPRLKALSEECKKLGIDFLNIEMTNLNQTYRSYYEERAKEFKNITLFQGQELDKLDQKQVWISLRRILDEQKPDVIFLYGYTMPCAFQLKFWAEKKKIATVLISDSNEYDKKRRWLFEFLKSLFVSRFDGAFVGGTDAGKYIQTLGIPAQRITVGYDVVDNQSYADKAKELIQNTEQVRTQWDLPTNYFLFVGRLVGEKNLPRLLKAYDQYINLVKSDGEPWDLVLCGGGPEEERLRHDMSMLSERAQKYIKIYGQIHHSDLVNFYACANCLILPSISETWGLVVNEAMACSLPVLVSNKVGCAVDLVREGSNGWLFDPFEINEMTRLMIKVSELDLSTRHEMGLSGYRIISEWDLGRFTAGALEISKIVYEYRKHCFPHPSGVISTIAD